MYAKIEPLTLVLGEAFRRYVVPDSMVSIDKMVVRFTGRSSHKIKIFVLAASRWKISWLKKSRKARPGRSHLLLHPHSILDLDDQRLSSELNDW